MNNEMIIVALSLSLALVSIVSTLHSVLRDYWNYKQTMTLTRNATFVQASPGEENDKKP